MAEVPSGGPDDEKEATRASVRTSPSLNELDVGRFVVETVDIIMWLVNSAWDDEHVSVIGAVRARDGAAVSVRVVVAGA